MAFDGQSTHVVGGFNGAAGLRDLNDLWSLVGDRWTYMGDSNGMWTSAAFDQARDVLVVSRDTGRLETSERVGTQWRQVIPPADLASCWQCQVVYDPGRQACLFYGFGRSKSLARFWAYGAGGWTSLGGIGPGPGAGKFRIVPEPSGSILWIGEAASSNTMQAWRWQVGGSWTRLQDPPALVAFDVTHSPLTLTPFLVGLQSWGGRVRARQFTGTTWQAAFTFGPAFYVGSGFAVCHDGQRLILFGGRLPFGQVLHGQTWAISQGAWNGWSRVEGSAPPLFIDSRNVQVAWNEATQSSFVRGLTEGGRTETWEWIGDRAFLRQVEIGSAAENLLAYDAVRDRLVMLNPVDGTTYEWVRGAWSVVGGPGFGPVMGFQPKGSLGFDGRRVICYFFNGSGTNGETWGYDGVGWVKYTVTSPAVDRAMLCNDRERGRVFLLGQGSTFMYAWDGVSWSAGIRLPDVGVPSRHEFVAGYHPARGRFLYGGGIENDFSGPQPRRVPVRDFYEWDGVAFKRILDLPADGLTGRLVPRAEGDLFVSSSDPASSVLIGSAFASDVRAFGRGCAGNSGAPRLVANSWDAPWLGDNMSMRCEDLPPSAGQVAFVVGQSRDRYLGAQLPIDLALAGAPGCLQSVSIDSVLLSPVNNGVASLSSAVPAIPSWVGLAVHFQCVVPDPAANQLGWITSNGLTMTVGNR